MTKDKAGTPDKGGSDKGGSDKGGGAKERSTKDKDRAQAALSSWRDAEAAYVRATARFLLDEGQPAMTKDELIDLVALRSTADRWREKYFKRQRS